ncbi:transposase-like zinc-binding domain-containing protein [Leptothermofonsia sp. ETS-13]|uniref:IS1/IS1595 family N-terminal zinc-binding domain-containing protein n=1 Tax=Leptothermofonsia sp. ETS-13 TaxID=3035696 RepID=UPI003BA31183
MKYPRCGSEDVRKNGHWRNKQNYRCKNCDRQFVKSYSQRRYSSDIRQLCAKMHQSGIRFHEIEYFT